MNDTNRVMQSYGRCCASPRFFDDFYATFLASSPAIREKFARTDMTAQKQLLRADILNLVLFARGMPDTKLRALGQSHSREQLNIHPELYDLWIAALLKTIGQLIFWVLLLMAIMSWVSQGRSPVEFVLMQLADPLLRPIRRLLPSMGGIDFSPMILVLLLYVINMGIAELLQGTGNMLLPGLWMAL